MWVAAPTAAKGRKVTRTRLAPRYKLALALGAMQFRTCDDLGALAARSAHIAPRMGGFRWGVRVARTGVGSGHGPLSYVGYERTDYPTAHFS